jgi:hypothetical protein
MQNHTHTHQSCSQVVDLATRGHWTTSISLDGSENWFLACNEIAKLSEPALLFPMIIGIRMKDCSSWKQWSLDKGWNCSSWCQEVLGYLPRTWLRGRSMSQELFSQLCLRDEQPNHPLSQELFYQLRDRGGGGRMEKSKSLRPTRSIICAIARSRSREEGSKCLALLYQKKEPYTS